MQDSSKGQPSAPGPQQHSSHRHQPTEEELKSARTCIRYFLLFGVLALLTSTLPLPWKTAAVAFGIASIVFGIIGLVKANRARFPRALRIGLTLGIGAALLLTVATSALVMVWPVTVEYESCMDQALTQAAGAECLQIYQDTLEDLSGALTE